MTAPLAVAEAGFVPPRFDRVIELRDFLDRCPSSATTRGIFMSELCSHVLRQSGTAPPALYAGLTLRRWSAFRTYPLADFIKLAFNAARLLHPLHPVGEGLRRIGWLGYPSFATTMAGRVILFALGEQMGSIIESAPKAYKAVLPGATVTVLRREPQRYLVELRHVYNFLDTYQVGVFEGAIRANRLEPQIRLRPHSQACDADFDVRWQ